MITPEQAIDIIDRWDRDMTPKYRGFVCGECGKANMRKAWHIHVDFKHQRRELHLCRKCGLKFDLVVTE